MSLFVLYTEEVNPMGFDHSKGGIIMLKKAGCVIIALMLVLSLGIASLVTASAESGDGLYVYTADKVYNPQVGDIITYKIDLQAEELFENIQVHITYDSSKLKVIREENNDPDLELWEVESPLRCPNVEDAMVNLQNSGVVRFLGSKISGYNFKVEKNLFNVQFEVVEEGLAVIKFDVEEMWIKGGEKAYFQTIEGAPEVAEGIFINDYVESMQECTDYPERPTEPTTAPTTVPISPTIPSQPLHTTTLYFYADEDWSDRIYCYSYNGMNMPNGAWPGTLCKDEGFGVYSVEVPETAAYVIFTDVFSNQTMDMPVPNESQVAVFEGIYVTNSSGMYVALYEWKDTLILDDIMRPDYIRPTYPVVRPTYPINPDSPATPDEVWPEDTPPTEPCVTDPCETMPSEAYPMSPDCSDKPQMNEPTEAPAADATSATDKVVEDTADTVTTGDMRIIAVSAIFVTLIMLSGAVILKKHSFR